MIGTRSAARSSRDQVTTVFVPRQCGRTAATSAPGRFSVLPLGASIVGRMRSNHSLAVRD